VARATSDRDISRMSARRLHARPPATWTSPVRAAANAFATAACPGAAGVTMTPIGAWHANAASSVRGVKSTGAWTTVRCADGAARACAHAASTATLPCLSVATATENSASCAGACVASAAVARRAAIVTRIRLARCCF
jgi:hypothetical protein